MRKNAFPITAGVLGSLALAVSASGQFINVTIEDYAAIGQPAGSETFRVVAHFENPNDITLAWGAIPVDQGGQKLIFFTGNGVDLMNDPLSPFIGTFFEDFAQFPIGSDWDSWVTVGTTGFLGNQTTYSPGFIGSDGVAAFIVGSAFNELDGLVFDSDPLSPVTGTDIVIAQFTLPKGNGFHLEGIVAWNPPAPPGGGGDKFQIGLFVVDNIPAPGALALLGLAGLAGARRRRRG